MEEEIDMDFDRKEMRLTQGSQPHGPRARRGPGRPRDEQPTTTAGVEYLMRPSLTQTLLPAAPRIAQKAGSLAPQELISAMHVSDGRTRMLDCRDLWSYNLSGNLLSKKCYFLFPQKEEKRCGGAPGG
ncbi:hypothetical protein EYD10_11021 [Varanus komodoensis]|nr:hypothetical protein EYD10_11021 [Varanus komodoensis]